MAEFSQEDKERLFAFYNPAIEEWGKDDARSLRWTAERQQLERFRALCEIGVAGNTSILDVGCGFGDLYGYMAARYANFRYLGIDINSEMIAIAKEKYPGTAFEVADFGIWNNNSAFDFCLASGTFSFKIEHHEAVYFSYIKKMYQLSLVGAAFNMLDSRYHINDAIFAAYDPKAVYNFCKTITPNVELRDDYLPQDFTVYLFK